ncbi:MAG TPA: DUF3179 domain-containing protein [bacterium]|nr:DUF3179 domain-containing protein [bacterium]
MSQHRMLWLFAAGAFLIELLGPPVLAAPAPERPPFDTSEWKTDFGRHSVALSEIMSGGPPKDGIRAVDTPEFVSVSAADGWLKLREPVILFVRGDDVRAYPVQILIWHEIVNDTVGGLPVAITFCPLCNTAIAFDRRVQDRTLSFGTTGKLRFSDLVMYDRQTESWWQQATGQAIVGALTGTQLTPLPAQTISWGTFKEAFPDGKVLSRHTGYNRAYGQNPYVGYDDVNSSPFLYRGPNDPRLRPVERVVTVSLGGEDVAYPFSALEKIRVANDTVGGNKIVVIFEKGVTSALDRSSIPESRDIGTAGVFERAAGGKVLTFAVAGGRITDAQSGSVWTILGAAISGPLAGTHLVPVVHGQHFWFAWAVFRPKTRVYAP